MFIILLFIPVLIVLFLLLLLIFYRLVFLRNPQRAIPKGQGIASPADGKVIAITRLHNQKEFQLEKKNAVVNVSDIDNTVYIITIVLGLLNVHYQRSPISGKVEDISYRKGSFFNAVANMPRLENERNEITIANKNTKVKVIQIAGFLARRIHCFVKIGQKVNKGSTIGLISLGSQVCIVLPKNISLKTKVNDKVKAGETIIAVLK